MTESNNVQERIEGWLLDIYAMNGNEMILWVKTENGKTVRLTDRVRFSIYVHAKEQELRILQTILASNRAVAACEFDRKRVRLSDCEKSLVLRVELTDCRKATALAEEILELGRYKKYELFNVDLLPAQTYLYEKDLFPLAYASVEKTEDGLRWAVKDSVESVSYRLPPLKTLELALAAQTSSRIPSLRDPIDKILLTNNGEYLTIDSGSEREKLLELVEVIRHEDPDVLRTADGDSFLFPYLARRARVNNVLEEFVLGREKIPLIDKERKSQVYFSYGRIYFRPAPYKLLGRLHIDTESAGMFFDCGLEGLAEVSRLCRMPIQKTSRSTIGTSMTSMQLYQATRDGVLIPWKKKETESYKNAWDLFVADRGGFYFEPKIGVFDNVGELDFASMYPTLMVKENLSPETVNCECCRDSSKRVPELDYNLCVKRLGLVPRVLKLPVDKRAEYKKLKESTTDPYLTKVYKQRRAALKWILVCCFGYLGFRNARFGKVDAHIAVCAFARDLLLKTAELSASKGFELIHGIVDSLYLQKTSARDEDFVELSKVIEKELRFPISFEGRFKWVVFLPSKVNRSVPVLNRFYGVFSDGRIKTRGIELRRHDTPVFIFNCQNDMIQTLSKADDAKQFMEQIPPALDVLRNYMHLLRLREVDLSELVITKNLSKFPNEYLHDVAQAIVARKLSDAGVEVSAGQTIKYIFTDASNAKSKKRVVPAVLVDFDTEYDVEKYTQLLIASAYNILSPFGYTPQTIAKLVERRVNVETYGASVEPSILRLGS
ncbi:MAG: DNA polymerase domain-containing protein [Candidatus Bathyarchaeia archaeon]